MFLLIASAAFATTYSFDVDVPVISNAPSAGIHTDSATDVGSSNESRAKGAAITACTGWAPLSAQIVPNGEFFVTTGNRDSAHWPTIPSTATCSGTYGGNTYTATVHLIQRTFDWTNDGEITSWTTGAVFHLGSVTGVGGGAWTQLPTYDTWTAGTYTVTKTGGGTWAGAECKVAQAETGTLDAVRVTVDGTTVAGTGSCTVTRSGGSLVIPITVTR